MMHCFWNAPNRGLAEYRWHVFCIPASNLLRNLVAHNQAFLRALHAILVVYYGGEHDLSMGGYCEARTRLTTRIFWGTSPQGKRMFTVGQVPLSLGAIVVETNLAERPSQLEPTGNAIGFPPSARFRRSLKRLMDLGLLLFCCPFFLPVFVLIALAIRLSSPGPVFYGQERIGFRGRSFLMWKFRSMVVNADQMLDGYLDTNPGLKEEWHQTHKLVRDPRITPIGRFLRVTSLDELPQLWNVFLGDMSLVGPRPIVDHPSYDEAYVNLHPDVFELYKSVRPGLTGLWQISGRNHTSYEQRIKLDRIYLCHWSLRRDLYILIRTVLTVIRREGAV